MTELPRSRFFRLAGVGAVGWLWLTGNLAALDAPQARKHQSRPKNQHSAKAIEDLPCPRAQWKGDPVCADAPDENTLPMPHLNRPTIAQPEGQSVKIGAKWQANNRVTTATPRLVDAPGEDFQSRNTPPDTHVNIGVDMKF